MTQSNGRLKWLCRRGMVELDLLLLGFLENKYPHLCQEDQENFHNLLEESDNQLQDWILGRVRPEYQGYQDIVSSIKRASCHPDQTI